MKEVTWGTVLAMIRSVGLRGLPPANSGEGRVLHISDTPRTIFGTIEYVVDLLQPSVIIHTGDLADDIKLEIYPRETLPYCRACERLFSALAAPGRSVRISLGNHDSLEAMPPLPEGFTVTEGTTSFEYRGATFTTSHYPPTEGEGPSTFRLFGHDLSVRTGNAGETCLLNGVEGMWLIDPVRERAERIDYPKRTDAARMCRKRRRAW